MEKKINKSLLKLLCGDITDLDTDAIVNAANSHLTLGGGVAGAIRKKGGEEIERACRKLGGTPVGTAVITTGGKLKARFVIHAVGPRVEEENASQKLAQATRSALQVADDNNLKSIALPAISTGVFGFPVEKAAEIMLRETVNYLKGKTQLQEVIFCLYNQSTYKIFEEKLKII
jgi:O-acetyl-ADP-ribose deacetylase (regulator of RNase III)